MQLRPALALGSLAVLASHAAAQGRTWVVDDGHPGGDFTSIQAAVDAAGAGDVIYVRPGNYGPFAILGKGISVIGEDPNLTRVREGTFTGVDETVEIRGVPLGETCLVQGLWIQNDRGRLGVYDNAGSVWIERCRLREDYANDFSNWAVIATDTASLFLVDTATSQGVWLTDTNARLYGCDLVAEDKTYSAPAFTPGLPGLRVEGGSAFLAGNTIRGGQGAPSPSSVLCQAGPGGAAVELVGDAPIVHDLDNVLEGGRYGLGFTCPDIFAAPFDVQAGQAFPLAGAARAIANRPIVLPGEVLRILSTGIAGDLVFRYAAFDLAPQLLLSLNGVGLLSAFLSLPPVATLGGPEGVADFTAPSLPPVVSSLRLFTQGLHLGADGVDVLSGGSGVVIVQPAASATAQTDCDGNGVADAWDLQFGDGDDFNRDGILDACQALPVVWVDDDAPGDPGPGDPTVSSPNEDGSLAAPFDSIQEAIDAAPPGSYAIVRLRDGLYRGPGNGSLSFGGRDLALVSENGPDGCVLDGEGQQNLIVLDQGESRAVRIEGLTITGGAYRAIYLAPASPTIVGCRFVGNGGDRGAAISAFGQGFPLVAGSHPVVVDCEFVGNTASFGGGAIYYSPISTFNSQDDHRTIEVRDCSFEGNVATGYGGGAMYVGSGGSLLPPRISGCRFVDNEADETGGAIRTESTLLVENSLFAGNRAGSRGGAISVAWGANVLQVDGCTFTDNRSTLSGGNVFYVGGNVSGVDATGSIFWGNGWPVDPFDFESVSAEPMRFDYCLVQGGANAFAPGTGFSFDAMKFANPLFADAAAGDLTLLSGSPAIDAGPLASTPRLFETDLNGGPRLVGPAIDLGAFEAP